MTRLKLTGGAAKGRALPAPVPPGVRPTSSRVREALFSMVGQDLEESCVLDAFGGSGLLALEAWSRGGRVTVVDRDRAAIASIRRNAQRLGAVLDIVCGDVCALAPSLGRFDLVLIDPPYREDPQPILDALAQTCTRWLVLETEASVAAPPAPPSFAIDRRRVYGGSALTLYRHDPAATRPPDARRDD